MRTVTGMKWKRQKIALGRRYDMSIVRDEMPEGLGFSMAMNEEAMVNFGKMTKEQRRKVITESKLAKSKDEMSQLVDRIASNSFQG